MPKVFKSLVRKLLFAGDGNLKAMDNPYEALSRVLRGHDVRVILDAGASDGRISQRLLKVFPAAQVHAFEPQASYRDQLTELAAADPRVVPHICALAAEEGAGTLHVTQARGSTSLLKPGERLARLTPAAATIEHEQEIETVTIDGWATRSDIAGVDLMKFDIQGGEVAALRGGVDQLRNHTLAIYTEILFNELYEDGALYSEVDLLLREFGFILHDMYKVHYGSDGVLSYANAVFLHADRMGL